MKLLKNTISLVNHSIKKAFDVITGKAIPTESEIEKVKPNLSAEEFEKLKDELKAEVIPDYWLTVFKNCE